MAGNIESHSILNAGESTLPITAYLDFENYGFSKLRFINESALAFSFIMGADGSIGDELLLLKRGSSCPGSNGTTSSTSATGKPTSSTVSVGGYNATSTSASTTASGTGIGSVTGTSTSVIVYPTSSVSPTSESITYTTEVVTSYTTYCPASTTFVQGSSTYTVTTVSFSSFLLHISGPFHKICFSFNVPIFYHI